MTPETALLAATAVHFGFQTTVTALVYPALNQVPAHQWATAHRVHSRAITPIVAVVYGTLALAGWWALLSEPDTWTLISLAAIAVTVLLTATAAAPAHGHLAAGHDQQRLRRLLRVDRGRAAAATLAFLAAALAIRPF